MTKGIVMEVGNRDCVVLTETGAFVRVRKHAASIAVGDEITLPAVRRSLPRRSWMMGSAAAAVLLFVFMFSMLPGAFQPSSTLVPADKTVAYVSIDINPSIELGIDESKQVVEVRELNEDGEKLLEDESLFGQKVDDAVRLIMEKAESRLLKDRTSADIVITSVVVETDTELAEDALTEGLQQEVRKVLEQHHKEQLEAFRVTVWSAPKEVREEAETKGLSTGKMAFYLKAKADGAEVTVDELKKESIHKVAERFKDKELLSPERQFTKEDMKRLLKKEKKENKNRSEDGKNDDDDDEEKDKDDKDDKDGKKGDDDRNDHEKDDDDQEDREDRKKEDDDREDRKKGDGRKDRKTEDREKDRDRNNDDDEDDREDEDRVHEQSNRRDEGRDDEDYSGLESGYGDKSDQGSSGKSKHDRGDDRKGEKDDENEKKDRDRDEDNSGRVNGGNDENKDRRGRDRGNDDIETNRERDHEKDREQDREIHNNDD